MKLGLRLARPRRPRSLDDALLPLINIVFLLMVFFLFAGRLGGMRADAQGPSSLGEPRAAAVAPRQLELRADGLLSDGGAVFAEAELSVRAAGWRGMAVDVRAPAEAPADRVLHLLGVLRAAGVGELRLLTVRARRGG